MSFLTDWLDMLEGIKEAKRFNQNFFKYKYKMLSNTQGEREYSI